MKPFLLFTLLLLSTLLYEAQGVRLGKVTLLASNHQQIIKVLLIEERNQDDELLEKASKFAPGLNRRLMTKTTPSTTTTITSKNDGNKIDPESEIKSKNGVIEKQENSAASLPSEHVKTKVAPQRYPDVVDLAGMDYSPARRKPPIHN